MAISLREKFTMAFNRLMAEERKHEMGKSRPEVLRAARKAEQEARMALVMYDWPRA